MFIFLIKSSKPANVKCPVKNRVVKKAEAIPKLDISSSKPKRKALLHKKGFNRKVHRALA